MGIHLSKSKYCCAVQCPKMLWMQKYRPEMFDDSVLNEAVLSQGNVVGDLAMGLFGPYTEVPYCAENLSEMVETTAKLLADGTETICEASFAYENLFCSVDILRNFGDGIVELYEVKSSTYVKEIYKHDISYQRYILKQLGFTVRKACLVHINSAYVRMGELETDKLFTAEDLTAEVEGTEDSVEAYIRYMETYLEQMEEPADGIGKKCFEPYACGFFRYCTRMLPKPNVFDVAGMHTSKKLEYCSKGICSFEHLLEEKNLNAKVRQQTETEVERLGPQIETEAVRKFLRENFTYPLYFLDFESFGPAVPKYENSRPFQQIPFQYSLDYYLEENGELFHSEFLAYPGRDPRRELAEHLVKDIPENVCTVAYNMSFEKGRIKELAELYPDLSEHLLNIHDRIVDLMIPFRERMYYTREMQGSYSIKYVLPALFPDEPELDYHNLEQVHNGGEASATFEQMESMQREELERARENMLRYCGLDTFAMVKIYCRLKEI